MSCKRTDIIIKSAAKLNYCISAQKAIMSAQVGRKILFTDLELLDFCRILTIQLPRIIITNQHLYLKHVIFGLSKERPIFGDNPKAHNFKIRRISCRFHEIQQISCGFHEIRQFHVDFTKSGGFHADFTKSSRFHVDFMKST